MNNLYKAAEKVLEAWGWDFSEPRNALLKERMEALRQALAQPEWVGLTEKEMWQCWNQSSYRETWKAIEAKLKEKNNGQNTTES
jgi:hypothetical protein